MRSSPRSVTSPQPPPFATGCERCPPTAAATPTTSRSSRACPSFWPPPTPKPRRCTPNWKTPPATSSAGATPLTSPAWTHTALNPDAPLPDHVLDAPPQTSFGASIYQLARQAPAPFREVARHVSALPGALDFTGTPEGLADLITDWWQAGASDGFTLMPHLLPDQADFFVDHVVPILQRRGIARREYRGTTLREHTGLPRPTH